MLNYLLDTLTYDSGVGGGALYLADLAKGFLGISLLLPVLELILNWYRTEASGVPTFVCLSFRPIQLHFGDHTSDVIK